MVVSVHGDHSAGFHIQELDTFALFGLKIVTIPGSNYVWGVSVNGQDLLYDGVTDKRPAIQLSKACRYDIVAQDFDCASAFVDKNDNSAPAVERMEETTPSCINPIISQERTGPATNSMVGATNYSNMIVVPHCDNIPRRFYQC